MSSWIYSSNLLLLLMLVCSFAMVSSSRYERLKKRIMAQDSCICKELNPILEQLDTHSNQLETIIKLLKATDEPTFIQEDKELEIIDLNENEQLRKENDTLIDEELLHRIKRWFSDAKAEFIREQTERTNALEALFEKLLNASNDIINRTQKLTDDALTQMNYTIKEAEDNLKEVLNAAGEHEAYKKETVFKVLDILHNNTLSEIYHHANENSLSIKKVCHSNERTAVLSNVFDACDLLTENDTSEYIIESDKVRLADVIIDSSGGISGRVEVYYNGLWGTICDDFFEVRDATVICNMLGYKKGNYTHAAGIRYGTGNIWLDNLRCNGDEESIFDCERYESNIWFHWGNIDDDGDGDVDDLDISNEVGEHDCSHYQDAFVVCTNE